MNKKSLNEQKNKVDTFYHLLKKEGISLSVTDLFRKFIYDYYTTFARELPWRKTKDPYLILVSEIMLQQTQVERVLPKYILFVKTFPDISSLAEAPTKKILKLWQGLGYNRRALALHASAKSIVNNFHGEIPSQEHELIKFPGIGKATACAIATFAFNKPAVFIETKKPYFEAIIYRGCPSLSPSPINGLIVSTLK